MIPTDQRVIYQYYLGSGQAEGMSKEEATETDYYHNWNKTTLFC